MLENKVYNFSDLQAILLEEKQKNEFKPKFGKGYSARTEANQNEKAVKDIAKKTKEMDGGLTDKKERRANPQDVRDQNKTTLDYDYAYEPSDEYKERVKSQVHGYVSKANEDNHKKNDDESNADFKGNEDFYNDRKEIRKDNAKAKQEYKHAGLKAHNLPKETFKDKTLFNESKKMKRLHFKNTTFLNESQMIKKIPDDYKVDGNKFIMKDSKGNEYLVECKKDALCESYVHVNVLNHKCGKEAINETLANFNRLSGYKSSDYNKSVEQVAESVKYNDLLGIARSLVTDGLKGE